MSHVAYHNTTPLYGDDLISAVAAAHKQDEAVLIIMRSGGAWTPSELHEYLECCGHKWPITSVRRALSNLTKAGYLTITGSTVMGPHGRPENVWALDTSRREK